ncbi:MAG: hypothetical protein MZV64_59300 [Ignavibacteriales bacterium]|nr:hypothetical protein [Ignavibacteriales bacterium]
MAWGGGSANGGGRGVEPSQPRPGPGSELARGARLARTVLPADGESPPGVGRISVRRETRAAEPRLVRFDRGGVCEPGRPDPGARSLSVRDDDCPRGCVLLAFAGGFLRTERRPHSGCWSPCRAKGCPVDAERSVGAGYARLGAGAGRQVLRGGAVPLAGVGV